MSTERLNERHLAVLQGYANGRTTKELCAELGYAEGWVWDLAMQARRVLGATTTPQAVALAMSLGLIEVEHGQGARLRRARHLALQLADLLDPA